MATRDQALEVPGPRAGAGWLPADPERAGDLGDLAATIRTTLGADAVLVAARSRDGALEVAAEAGLDAAVMLDLLDGLRDISADERIETDRLLELDPPAAAVIARHGYPHAVCASLELDGVPVGMLGVLSRVRPDVELVVPFARLAAVGIARMQRDRPARLLEHVARIHDAFDRYAIGSSTSTPEQLTHGIAATLADILDVPLTALMIYDEQRQVLQMARGSFGADDERVASYQISVFDPHSNAARVFATGQPYVSNDAVVDPGIRPGYVQAFGIRRLLSVPLRMGARRVGVLHLANKEDEFTLDDLVRAEALAPRVASLVELARTSFRLRREERLEGVLSKLALAIASGRGLQALLPPAFDELCEATEASLLALVTPEGPPVVVRRTPPRAELEDDVLATAATHPGERADVGVPETVGDPGWASFHVPVHMGATRVGTVTALRERGEPFAPDERRAFLRVAQLAALAWATESYQQQGAQLARLQERQRISAELHEDVRELLFETQTHLDRTLRDPALDHELRTSVTRARGLVIRGTTAVRSVAHQLQRGPSCDLPLRLRSVVSGVEQEFSLPVRLQLTPAASAAARDLPAPLADVVVKVTREALVNAAKHGGRCSADVHLAVGPDGGLLLSVLDDGPGLGPDSGARHGLSSLHRTVGDHGCRLEVGPGPGGGTLVTASVPVTA